MKDFFLTVGDADRCLSSLSKLSRHLEQPVVVTGSIAASLHLAKKGLQWKKPLNDIDTVVENLSAVCVSIKEDFLINHFHPFRGEGRVLLQLVDAENGTRIEIFTPNSKTFSERLTDFAIRNLSVKSVSVEDLLAKLLSIVYSVAQSDAVDPKYVEHFRRLLASAELTATREIWHDYRKEFQPIDFDEAVETVERSIAANPNLLQAEEYCQNKNFVCRWCCDSETFPVSNRTKIYEMLGYV